MQGNITYIQIEKCKKENATKCRNSCPLCILVDCKRLYLRKCAQTFVEICTYLDTTVLTIVKVASMYKSR